MITDMFKSTFFAGNRAALKKSFGGTAPIVIAGNSLLQKTGDASYQFRQDSNFWYVTGLEHPGFILVMDGDKEYLIAPERDAVWDAFEGPIDYDLIANTTGIKSILNFKEGMEKLGRRLKQVKQAATLQPPPRFIATHTMFSNPARFHLIGLLSDHNPDIDLIDLRTHFTKLRLLKQPEELAAIKQAIAVTMDGLRYVDKKYDRFKNERQLYAELLYFGANRGVEFGYTPIIANGKNAAILHYEHNNAQISHDQVTLLDVGYSHRMYSADISRSIVRNPSKRQEDVYEATMAVFNFACSLLKPGTNMRTYEESVRQYMGEKLQELGLIKSVTEEALKYRYPQLTSHFIGLDVHDVGDRDTVLSEGMVLTVEPGIYIPEEDLGIRIEDMMLVTKDDIENITGDLIKDIRGMN